VGAALPGADPAEQSFAGLSTPPAVLTLLPEQYGMQDIEPIDEHHTSPGV